MYIQDKIQDKRRLPNEVSSPRETAENLSKTTFYPINVLFCTHRGINIVNSFFNGVIPALQECTF